VKGRTLLALAATTHLAALGSGYALAPRQVIDEEAEHQGLFVKNTSKILAATVESLREENRLANRLYSYRAAITTITGLRRKSTTDNSSWGCSMSTRH